MPVYNPDTIKMIGNKCLRVWPLHWSQVIIYTLPCKAFSKALAKIPYSEGIRASDVTDVRKHRENQKNRKKPKRPAERRPKPSRKPKKTK